ncbi:shikimate kinase [Stenotrophomonas hibiscicola]|uniref:shikimate kinase n=1 Tax=Stenotrophomonas hibiscicola TaxID=86189 RepID=UPI0032088651
MNPAPNLILIGPMGAGKTCIGRRLAERFTLDFVDVDQAIVDAAGASIPTIFEHAGEAGFRHHERQALARVLEGRSQLVSTGGGAVLDPDNRALIARRGFVVYLRVGVAAQLERLARDKGRPLLQRPDREQVLHDLAAQRDPLYRELADLTLDTDPYTAADATAQLVVKLATQWQRQDMTT